MRNRPRTVLSARGLIGLIMLLLACAVVAFSAPLARADVTHAALTRSPTH